MSEEPDPAEMEAFLVRDDVVDEFAARAPIHGLHYVFDRKQFRLWKRLIWFVLVCGGLGRLTVWQFTALITEYHNYAVVTSVETIVPPALSFPVVTVCNTNPIRESKFQASGLEQRQPANNEEMYNASSSTLEETILAFTFNENKLSSEDLSRFGKPMLTFFGVCFQFETDEQVFQPVYYGGLELLVDLEQYDSSTRVEQVHEAGAQNLCSSAQHDNQRTIQKYQCGSRPRF